MTSSDERPKLGNNASDYAAMVARGAANAVPFAGGLLTEIINNIIPDQRIERLELYLKLLSQKLDALDAESGRASRVTMRPSL
jgi:hypothetical protein